MLSRQRCYLRTDRRHTLTTIANSVHTAKKPHGLEINPLVVATIQRFPHSTTDSTLPSPGKVSPRAAFHVTPGPSNVAMPLTTFRTVQPSMVVGLVSGTGTSLRPTFGWPFFVAVSDDVVSGFVAAGGGAGV